MSTKVWPWLRERGWTKRRSSFSYRSQIPFSFYGREGPDISPVHVAFFFWCRGPPVYRYTRRGKKVKTKHQELYFRNCKGRSGKRAPKHGAFPEVAMAKGIDKWRTSMHTTTKVVFPRKKLPWHRTWIWVAHDLEGFFNQVISPFSMEARRESAEHLFAHST